MLSNRMIASSFFEQLIERDGILKTIENYQRRRPFLRERPIGKPGSDAAMTLFGLARIRRKGLRRYHICNKYLFSWTKLESQKIYDLPSMTDCTTSESEWTGDGSLSASSGWIKKCHYFMFLRRLNFGSVGFGLSDLVNFLKDLSEWLAWQLDACFGCLTMVLGVAFKNSLFSGWNLIPTSDFQLSDFRVVLLVCNYLYLHK